jgi:hypothetical protein
MHTLHQHPVYPEARVIIQCPGSASHNSPATVLYSDNINGWTVQPDNHSNKLSFEAEELIVQDHH